MANGLHITNDSISVNLSTMEARVNRRIAVVMNRSAQQMQNYARNNAPWTDRTGNARNGLFAKATSNGGNHRIDLFHSVPYGIWLEVRWGGRYEIIRPTLEQGGQRLAPMLQAVLAP